ncbi:MAG: hypothetical protein MPW15_00110 [Candidatus Manganitrophus sp.]|nr:hypothetical protein [Candidatus Manganitrophus sp.]
MPFITAETATSRISILVEIGDGKSDGKVRPLSSRIDPKIKRDGRRETPSHYSRRRVIVPTGAIGNDKIVQVCRPYESLRQGEMLRKTLHNGRGRRKMDGRHRTGADVSVPGVEQD